VAARRVASGRHGSNELNLGGAPLTVKLHTPPLCSASRCQASLHKWREPRLSFRLQLQARTGAERTDPDRGPPGKNADPLLVVTGRWTPGHPEGAEAQTNDQGEEADVGDEAPNADSTQQIRQLGFVGNLQERRRPPDPSEKEASDDDGSQAGGQTVEARR